MAIITMACQFKSSVHFNRILYNYKPVQICHEATNINLCTAEHNISGRLLNLCSSRRGLRSLSKPISAVRSGSEVSANPKGNPITIKDAKIVVEYQDDDKIGLRVDVPGNETQRVFDLILADFARSAPPIPGFRRQKGGKTTKVPKDFLLQVLGEERVTKFVIEEIFHSTVADYVKKENLKVKDDMITAAQTTEEIKSSFVPGMDFGFNVTMKLENLEAETTGS